MKVLEEELTAEFDNLRIVEEAGSGQNVLRIVDRDLDATRVDVVHELAEGLRGQLVERYPPLAALAQVAREHRLEVGTADSEDIPMTRNLLVADAEDRVGEDGLRPEGVQPAKYLQGVAVVLKDLRHLDRRVAAPSLVKHRLHFPSATAETVSNKL